MLGAGATAEDAAQEAVLRAWRQRSSCRDPGNPAAWLRRIAFNEALRALPRRGEVVVGELGEGAGPASPDPAEATGVLGMREMVSRLQPVDRRLLFLQHWADVPVSDIAARLQMPEGTVKIRLHRARAQLRRMIEEEP